MTDIKPCPLELSSYLEASSACVTGDQNPKENRVFLQSFADKICSGTTSCELRVSVFLNTEIQPCPLELSSYLEASSTCVKGTFPKIQTKLVFLQSFADKICSGTKSCELQVSRLLNTEIHPCPLELSSYLEASYTCLDGTKIIDILPVFLAKFCRRSLLGETKL